jgi:hypothetical protein
MMTTRPTKVHWLFVKPNPVALARSAVSRESPWEITISWNSAVLVP